MKYFFDEPILKDKPWLIVGKGPSFSKIWDTNLQKYYIFSLNHTASIIPCDIAHAIDLEVLDSKFVSNCKKAVLPWHPHLNCKVQRKTLKEFALENPYLDELEAQNKLYHYNLSTYKSVCINNSFGSPDKIRPYVTIKAKYFSGEAAFHILIEAGIRTIHSIGIDGGTEYASDFYHLKPLTNSQPTFNLQFDRINELIARYNIQYKAL